MNSFCEVLLELLLRSLLFSRTFYLRFTSFFIALSQGDLFIFITFIHVCQPLFSLSAFFLHFISPFFRSFLDRLSKITTKSGADFYTLTPLFALDTSLFIISHYFNCIRHKICRFLLFSNVTAKYGLSPSKETYSILISSIQRLYLLHLCAFHKEQHLIPSLCYFFYAKL